MEAWEKKVDRIENNPRRRAKESKVREYYEKQFPEIRKQREMQERMQKWVVLYCCELWRHLHGYVCFHKCIYIYIYVFLYSRGAQRGGGLASAARSEHEVSEIIDGISEQEVGVQLA